MKIVKDNFNSEIFQMDMGNVLLEEGEVPGAEEIRRLEQQAKDAGFSHLTFKVPSTDKKTLNAVLSEGFALADTLIEYVFDMKKATLPPMQHKCTLHDCREEELEALKEIAGKSFVIDRFHSDEHLDNERCDLYYERWIDNSYHGFAEKVIVAEYNGEPVGFTTGKTYEDDEYGHLVLSAVSDKYRGIGVYTSMIHEGISWMQKEHGDLKGVIVGTQLDNLAVQKAWIKLGFTVFDSLYVLQKYIGE